MSESTRVLGRDNVANIKAAKLCWEWSQAVVLAFKESSEGKTARFVFDDVDRGIAESEMLDLGIVGGLEENRRVITFATNQDEQEAIRRLSAALSTKARRTRGSMRLITPCMEGKPAKLPPVRRRSGVPQSLQSWFTDDEARPNESELVFSRQAPTHHNVNQAVACRYCAEGRVPRPLFDHFDPGTNRAWYTSWVGHLLPCHACRKEGRGPTVIVGEEDGTWTDPRLPNLRWRPARPGHMTVIFLGKGQVEAMRKAGKRAAEQPKQPEQPDEEPY